ncbi:alpha/beta fold hydrolase [Paenibacillus sp. SYP-B4298]|uniref:alpha/beta fold hydrolase n=1 Tax=Paenibacillus sp. SYP-B4298 TaxID=2996034 RepID=UPI0022DDB764|nr:alpha/beta fold hydrolase [Paenibacillus sp. SYP-B4298]
MWTQMKLGDDEDIYAVFQRPHDAPLADATLVVTFSGLAQSMSEKGFLFARLRKAAALLTCHFVQFDYRGHGDSAGDFRSASITSMTKDAVEVLNHFLRGGTYTKVICIGHALGAEIAAAAMNRMTREYPALALILIAISPPSWRQPPVSRLFPPEVLSALAEAKEIEASRLFPGRDYYGFSDFEKRLLAFLNNWGGHIQQVHGQYISSTMLEELDQFRSRRFITDYLREAVCIVGQKDEECAAMAKASGAQPLTMPGVRRYHDHASAAEQVIRWIIVELERECGRT